MRRSGRQAIEETHFRVMAENDHFNQNARLRNRIEILEHRVADLEAGKQELEAGKQELEAGRKEFREQLNKKVLPRGISIQEWESCKAALHASQLRVSQLEAGKKELEAGKQEYREQLHQVIMNGRIGIQEWDSCKAALQCILQLRNSQLEYAVHFSRWRISMLHDSLPFRVSAPSPHRLELLPLPLLYAAAPGEDRV